MNNITIMALSFLGCLCVSSPAVSGPSASEACHYFLSEVAIESTAKKNYFIIEMPDFIPVQTDLERYETYVALGIRIDFGQGSQADFHKLGEVSATAICLVDIVERQVIRISVLDGPLVGESTVNANGDTRTIRGPDTKMVDIGLKAHRGRY